MPRQHNLKQIVQTVSAFFANNNFYLYPLIFIFLLFHNHLFSNFLFSNFYLFRNTYFLFSNFYLVTTLKNVFFLVLCFYNHAIFFMLSNYCIVLLIQIELHIRNMKNTKMIKIATRSAKLRY